MAGVLLVYFNRIFILHMNISSKSRTVNPWSSTIILIPLAVILVSSILCPTMLLLRVGNNQVQFVGALSPRESTNYALIDFGASIDGLLDGLLNGLLVDHSSPQALRPNHGHSSQPTKS